MSKIFLALVIIGLNIFTFFYATDMKQVMVLIDYAVFMVVMAKILVHEEKESG